MQESVPESGINQISAFEILSGQVRPNACLAAGIEPGTVILDEFAQVSAAGLIQAP
jgi:hypothetical protein